MPFSTMLLCVSIAGAFLSGTQVSGYRRAHSGLLYTDVVVRGIVRVAREEFLPAREVRPDLGPQYQDLLIRVARVSTEVQEVMKGRYQENDLDLIVNESFVPPEVFHQDTQVIAAVSLDTHTRDGRFVLTAESAYYVRDGDA